MQSACMAGKREGPWERQHRPPVDTQIDISQRCCLALRTENRDERHMMLHHPAAPPPPTRNSRTPAKHLSPPDRHDPCCTA